MILMFEGIVIGFSAALPVGIAVGAYLSRLGFKHRMTKNEK